MLYLKKNIKKAHFYCIPESYQRNLEKGYFLISILSIFNVAKLCIVNAPKSVFLMPKLFKCLISLIKVKEKSKFAMLPWDKFSIFWRSQFSELCHSCNTCSISFAYLTLLNAPESHRKKVNIYFQDILLFIQKKTVREEYENSISHLPVPWNA